jgi:glyoxylase-like metal-dependent hydrolase (beta-lactamase superfamily II)
VRSTPLFAALALALSVPAAAQQRDFDAVEIRTVPLSEGLHVLFGAGGNIALSTGPDGPLLVDDQFAPLVPKIAAAVAELQDRPIHFVLNTHWHGDHTGGNEQLAGEGALIVAHEGVRRRMSEGQFNAALNRDIAPAAPGALPVVTFAEGVTLHWNGETIAVEHVAPAHTDGDSLVWFEQANAVHMGDTYFNGFYPFIDVASGGRIGGLIAAAERVLARANDATRIIPGHGPLSGRAELEVYRDMLVGVRDRVKAALSAGQSLEELAAADPLAEWNEAWGGGFMNPEQFLALVHADLSRP